MTPKLKNLLGTRLVKQFEKIEWCCKMRILRGIQSRHPHWYQRLLSRDIVTWLRIAKQPWYFNMRTRTVIYKPV